MKSTMTTKTANSSSSMSQMPQEQPRFSSFSLPVSRSTPSMFSSETFEALSSTWGGGGGGDQSTVNCIVHVLWPEDQSVQFCTYIQN